MRKIVLLFTIALLMAIDVMSRSKQQNESQYLYSEVTAVVVRVKVANDTIIYGNDTDEFPEGKSIDSLVRKLPGVVIDGNGDITLKGLDGKVSVLIYHGREIYNVNDTTSRREGFSADNVYHRYVDLGLSVKWATCNVGADKPEANGDYIAWGETVPKSEYTWENYRFHISGDNFFTNIRLSKYNMNSSSGVVDSLTTLEMIDDAAHVRWGGSWRMPTVYEFHELMVNCTWTWTTINGVNGYKITSNMPGYTDRSIFLPAVGLGYAHFNRKQNNEGIYWSSSLRPSTPGMPNSPYIISFASGGFSLGAGTQQKGYPIRPVCPNEKYESFKSPVGTSAGVDLPVQEGVIMPF